MYELPSAHLEPGLNISTPGLQWPELRSIRQGQPDEGRRSVEVALGNQDFSLHEYKFFDKNNDEIRLY